MMNAQKPDQRLSQTLESIKRNGNVLGDFKKLFDPTLEGAMKNPAQLKERILPILGPSKSEDVFNSSWDAKNPGWNPKFAFTLSANVIGVSGAVGLINETRGIEYAAQAFYSYVASDSRQSLPTEKTLRIVDGLSNGDEALNARALGALFSMKTNVLGQDAGTALDRAAVDLLVSARIVFGKDKTGEIGRIAFGEDRMNRAEYQLETVRSYGP
jgi:hypothetical protein